MKSCVACGYDLPVVASECSFCGTAQPEDVAGPTMIGYTSTADVERSPKHQNTTMIAGKQDGQGPTMLSSQLPPVGGPPPLGGPPPPVMMPPATISSTGPAAFRPPPAASANPTPVHLREHSRPSNPVSRGGAMAPNGKPMVTVSPQMIDKAKLERTQAVPTLSDPWLYSIRILGVTAGLLLLVSFFVPWKISDAGTVFAFTDFASQPFNHQATVAMIGVSCIFTFLVAAMPTTTAMRGVWYLVLALPGLAYYFYHATDGAGIVLQVSAVCAATALVVRSRYFSSLFARVFATAAIVAVAAIFFSPRGDAPSVFSTILEAVKAAETIEASVEVGIGLLQLLLAALTLFVWRPKQGDAGAASIAWFWILTPLIVAIIRISTNDSLSLESLGTAILLPLAIVAWTSLVVYGLASIIGKGIKHS